jgi:hypothetical protein
MSPSKKSRKRSAKAAAPSDKNRVIAAEVIARAWQDEDFKKRLLTDPKKVLEDAGVDDIPAGTEVRAVENTDTVKYLVLPEPELMANYEEQLLRVVRASIPLPDDTQVRLIQNTKEKRYLVIPTLPAGAPARLNASHVQLLAAAGWEAINLYTTANAVAEANAAAVANAVGATQVAGAAVAVAVIGVVLI